MRFQNVLVLALLASVACSKPAPFAPPPPEVTIFTTRLETVDAKLEYVGQAEASKRVEVRSQITGVIVARPYVEGTDVAAGTVLFRIDPTTYEAAYRGAQANLANATARFTNAERNVARMRPLLAEHAVAQVDLDNAETELQQARAAIDQAKGAADQAKKNFDDTFVRAQISGRAGRALLVLGARVTGPGDLLTTVEQVDPIYVTFNPSDRDVLAWRRSASTRRMLSSGGTLGVSVTLADGTVFPHPGKVGFVDLALQAQTGTLLLRAQFPNPEHLLLPGQFARVHPLGITRDSAILVPQRAVQTGLNGSFVYLLGDSNKVIARNVVATSWDGGRWLIDDGLKPGDRVVVDGAQKIAEGRTVRPSPYVPPPDSAATHNADVRPKIQVTP